MSVWFLSPALNWTRFPLRISTEDSTKILDIKKLSFIILFTKIKVEINQCALQWPLFSLLSVSLLFKPPALGPQNRKPSFIYQKFSFCQLRTVIIISLRRLVVIILLFPLRKSNISTNERQRNSMKTLFVSIRLNYNLLLYDSNYLSS